VAVQLTSFFRALKSETGTTTSLSFLHEDIQTIKEISRNNIEVFIDLNFGLQKQDEQRRKWAALMLNKR